MISINEFKKCDLATKIAYLDRGGDNFIDTKGIDLNRFFTSVLQDVTENNYVKQQALKAFLSLVMIKKINTRQALSLLIDNWDDNCEISLKIERYRALYLFFNEDESAIHDIYTESLLDDQGDVVAECNLRLGLFEFKKALSTDSKIEVLKHLLNAESYFIVSLTLIENRIDADIYGKICRLLINILNGEFESVHEAINQLSTQLFIFDAYTFNNYRDPLFLGLYRMLSNLVKIIQERPNEWLDFRDGLSKIFYQFSEIEDEQLNKVLFDNILISSTYKLLNNKIIVPFFSLHFEAQEGKIKNRLTEIEEGDESRFLQFLLEMPRDPLVKKSLNKEAVSVKFQSFFSNSSQTSIQEAIDGISNFEDPMQIITAYEKLAAPTMASFIDFILSACLRMQANRIYWCPCIEDDRNTFISDQLEASGYQAKDQTRRSTSAAGKAAGEIDIFVLDPKRFPFTIIEALNLTSLDKNYIALHLNKVFSYDANGNKANFILVYYDGHNFQNFCTKYYEYIANTHNFEYPRLLSKQYNATDYANLKIYETKHTRNGNKVSLYHIVMLTNIK